MADITFLKAPGFRVIDEVVALIGSNPECSELPSMLKQIAAKVPETIKTEAWRTVTGSSGGLYPLYISETEPFVVYAIAKRAPPPDVMVVLHVGMRANRRAADFFPAVRAEIDRRIAIQGWLP